MAQQNNDLEELKRQAIGQGMMIGMVLFMPFGVLISILTDNFAFIGIGLPIGVAVGVAIGEGIYQRKMQEYDNESN